LTLISSSSTTARGLDQAGTLIRALRLHNWLKNVLVFVPAVLAKAVNADTFSILLLAWVAFGFAASAHYLLNDFLDKDCDRRDAAKGQRPQVAGEMPARLAAGIALVLVVGAAICAAWLPLGAQLALASYLFLCLAYSLLLKRVLMIDVLTLVAVHDLRLVAGACAASIPFSPTLFLAGSCVFLSMALLKRDAQLAAATGGPSRSVAGRPYVSAHLPILRTLAAGAVIASVVTGAILIRELADQAARPEALWVVPALLGFWLCRCFFLAIRRTLDEDLVIFVCTDRFSLITLAGLVLLFIAAG
jgi:4-hydroxybenzoate polyprenyltransferase